MILLKKYLLDMENRLKLILLNNNKFNTNRVNGESSPISLM